MNESDDIIARIAADRGIDTATLPLLRTYADVLFPKTRRLRSEVAELKARLETA
jgi:hypothetical protein